MIKIGKFNKLKVVKKLSFGVYLDGEELGETLLPRKYVPTGCKPGDIIEAFIHKDSEERLIATTEKPYGVVGDFVLLKVVSVNDAGPFLNWGLLKDLFVPFREQNKKIPLGKIFRVPY